MRRHADEFRQKCLELSQNFLDHFKKKIVNPIPHGGGGGQILPSFRLSSLYLPLGMQQKHEIGDFSKNLMDNKISNMKMTNYQPESRDMAIFCKSTCQKVVKLHLYCHNF